MANYEIGPVYITVRKSSRHPEATISLQEQYKRRRENLFNGISIRLKSSEQGPLQKGSNDRMPPEE